MDLLRSFGDAARRGAALKAAEIQVYGSGASGLATFRQRMWQPGSQFDYDAEAGRLYDNGVVLPTVKWKSRAIGEARLVLQRLAADGKTWEALGLAERVAPAVSADDVLAAFEDPNDYYDLLTLLQGVQLSWDVRGQAFLYVRVGKGNRPIGFMWVYHEDCRPLADVGNPDGTKLVSRYEYRPKGGAIQHFAPARGADLARLDKGPMIQLRDGIDPLQPACGLSPLAATLRDVCLDNEVSTWLAGIVRNGATPGVVISPKAGVNPGDMSVDQRKRLGELWDSFVGDKRGKALPMPLPVDVTVPTWSPQQMELGKLRDVPMVRILAALGVDPLVMGLTAEKSTFANKEQAIDDAGKRTLVPTLQAWARQLTHQALPLWGVDARRYRLWFDTEGVSWLQDDKQERNKGVREDYKAGVIDRHTALVESGRAATDADKGVYYAAKPNADDDEDPLDDEKAARRAQDLKSYAVRRAQGHP